MCSASNAAQIWRALSIITKQLGDESPSVADGVKPSCTARPRWRTCSSLKPSAAQVLLRAASDVTSISAALRSAACWR